MNVHHNTCRKLNPDLENCLGQLKRILAPMGLHEKVQALNRVRRVVNELSPFSEPVDLVQWIPAGNVHANDYNPNKVASAEMNLLYTSIRLDGFTQPIVSYYLGDGQYEVTDGFHRDRIGTNYPDIAKRMFGYLPLSVISKPLDERIGSTIRHNRARGTHQIRSMSNIVITLSKMGWSDEKISRNLGMELDEIIRLKQISGLKEAFQNHKFSKSWTEFEHKYYK
ncbi:MULTISPECIES: IbrB-like domain-containing protein [unclassified Sporolactobacillus]|uniref:IbrB-like domain-containing protein n=1 Tax=unclassified Sporolactobacillus TaxID=2628533 RepID=UPI002368D207|nr:ParB/RepB/Spo0J family partition protein [Sporolactobacillus sp. CQH2019]MDD9150225.1 ParB/RepB/Spo0J family partition protein [Sporolactobacillus sp. CQH2019]